MITPDSFIETKYYLKFTADSLYTDVSGTVGSYAVTSAGKIPLLSRNRDFTLKIPTFSFKLYSTTEILRGMRFKAERDGTIIFHGFIDDVTYDENKDEYNVKIAHEFKLLQGYTIRKSELESILTSNKCTDILKVLFERVIDNTIDFTIADGYIAAGTGTLGGSYIELTMLWCFGLDYASSEPEEDLAGTYWQLFSQLMGLLGCIIYFDGSEYIVKHFTQDSNYDDTTIFLDKYKKTYIPTKYSYGNCDFPVAYDSTLANYSTSAQDPLEQTFYIGSDRVTGIKFFEISGISDNLLPVYEPVPAGANRIDLLSVGAYDNDKNYIMPYDKVQIETDFDMTNNLPAMKSYDPIKDTMSIEQHEVYEFEIEEYYWIDNTVKKTLTGASVLDLSDTVYVEFTKDIDENALDYIDVYLGSPIGGNVISTVKAFTDSKTVKLTFNSVVAGTYYLGVNYIVKSNTQAQLKYPVSAFSPYYAQIFTTSGGA